LNGVTSLAFLLAVLPAAQAQDDDAPSPAQVFWGMGACLFTAAWLALACYRAVHPGRHSSLPLRLGRVLSRWLSRDTPAIRQRLAHYRARQGGRDISRRRR